MFNVALVAFAVGLLWVAISLLGILYPFPPFRTRKRAFFSAGIALAAVLADATLTAIFVERPDPSSTTATAPAPIPPKTETAAAPVDTFSDSSFQWDDDTAKFKPQIITIVNRIAKENTDCPDPDPMSVALSNESKPNAPVFFVMCGSGKDVFSISFSPADADKKEPFAATPPISQSDAADACEAVAKASANHPSTVDFSRVWDAAFDAHKTGLARYSSTFTAKNSFGLELKYNIVCFFAGKELVDQAISEAK